MKGIITIFATIGGIAGAYVPVLFGDTSLLDGWSILGATVGGLIGVWVGFLVARRIAE